MSYKTIYHGSEKIVEKPEYHYLGSNPNNDYGLGFYCSRNLDMAKEWANRKTTSGFANKYHFNDKDLKILDLTDKNKYSVLNWIAILLHHRKIDEEIKLEYQNEFKYIEKFYIDVSKYDVVIGYRADDAYFRFPLMFVENVLTYKKLEEIYLNGNLGKQYVLISQKAFNRIKFVSAIPAETIYHDRYITRKDNADNSYRALEIQERQSSLDKIRDIMKKND